MDIKKITRRNFLEKIAIASASLPLVGISGCPSFPTSPAKNLSYGPNLCDMAWPISLEQPYIDPTKKLPVIAFFHGGAWTDLWGDKSVYFSELQRIADKGFVVCSFNFSNYYPESIDNIQTAINWASSLPHIDYNKIIMVGESSGGHLATKVAWDNPNIYAVVSHSGIYDLMSAEHPFIVKSLERTLGYTKKQKPFQWYYASSINYINSNSPQTMLMENYPDRLMPLEDTMEAVNKLNQYEVPIQHHRILGEDHASMNNRQLWWDILDQYLESVTSK